jgi:hypothetical protein
MYTNSSYVLRVTRFTPSRMSSPTHPHRNDIDNVHNHRGRIPFHQHHPGNAVSDPGAVAVWPPVRRPNIHGVTFDDVRVELRVSGVAAPTRSRHKSSRINYRGTSGHYTQSESRAAAAPVAAAAPARETRGRTPPTNKSGSYANNAHVRARRKATTTTCSPLRPIAP